MDNDLDDLRFILTYLPLATFNNSVTIIPCVKVLLIITAESQIFNLH